MSVVGVKDLYTGLLKRKVAPLVLDEKTVHQQNSTKILPPLKFNIQQPRASAEKFSQGANKNRAGINY